VVDVWRISCVGLLQRVLELEKRAGSRHTHNKYTHTRRRRFFAEYVRAAYGTENGVPLETVEGRSELVTGDAQRPWRR
jgi:hypothetical protein